MRVSAGWLNSGSNAHRSAATLVKVDTANCGSLRSDSLGIYERQKRDDVCSELHSNVDCLLTSRSFEASGSSVGTVEG